MRHMWLWVNLFPNKPLFLCVCSSSLLKTLRKKGKLLVTSKFSVTHSVCFHFGELSAILSNSKLSSANSFLKVVVWERVKKSPLFRKLIA